MILLYLFLFLWYTFSSKCTIHYCHNWQRVSGTVNNEKMVSNNSSTLATSIMATCFQLQRQFAVLYVCLNQIFCDMSHCIRATNIQSGISHLDPGLYFQAVLGQPAMCKKKKKLTFCLFLNIYKQ